MRKKNINYETPFIEEMDVEVEKGFAASEIGGDEVSAPSMPGGDDIFELQNLINDLN